HALFPRPHPAVSVPSGARQDCRLHDTPPPLLDLREQGSGPSSKRDVVDGPIAPVARRARGADRYAADGRDRHPRLLRAPVEVARQPDRRKTDRLVKGALAVHHKERRGHRVDSTTEARRNGGIWRPRCAFVTAVASSLLSALGTAELILNPCSPPSLPSGRV